MATSVSPERLAQGWDRETELHVLHVIPATLYVSTLTSHSVSDNSSRLQTGDQDELQIEYVWQADL